jgi:hypothetical protein
MSNESNARSRRDNAPRPEQLELNRETVQDLTEEETSHAAGGRMLAVPSDVCTYRCLSPACASAASPCP